MYNLRNPRQRARYLRATTRRRDSNFGAAERIIRAVFAKERKAMISALPRVGKVDKGEWTKAFKRVWILAGGDAWRYNEETWGGAQRSVTGKPRKSITPVLLHTFNYQFKAAPTPWLVHVAGYIDGVGGDNITEISATTQDKVKNAIFAGMEREEGIPDIAARVSDVYDGFEGYRATMIARSEVVDASNQASLAQAREAGSTLDLMWVATNDDRTREEHAEMDGVTVAYDQEFECDDGTTMPGEAVNCRCTIGYALPSEPVAEGAAATEGGGVFTDYNGAENAFKEYATTLTDGQRYGVEDYTVKTFRDINEYLYDPAAYKARIDVLGGITQGRYDATVIQTNSIREVLQGAPKLEGTVYRGFWSSDEVLYNSFKTAEKGKGITLNGFQSTTMDMDKVHRVMASMPSKDYQIFLEIRDARGAVIEPLSGVKQMRLNEILLDAGNNYEVIKSESIGANRVYVILKML